MRALRLDRIKNWIYVTGVIRSGTTFVGKALSLPREVDYIHEPFNGGRTLPDGRPLRATYLRPGETGPEARQVRQQLGQLFDLNIGLATSISPHDPWWTQRVKSIVGSRGPMNLRLAKFNPLHRAMVIKDPVGRLMAEYVYLYYDAVPVVVLRHPVSFIASLRRVGWWPELKGYSAQANLLQDYFPEEKAWFETEWPSRMAESAAHWRASYKVLLAQARQYTDWIVVTHESLSAEPVPSFQQLYSRLSLPWSASVERRILKMTQGKAQRSKNGRAMDLRRDSKAIAMESPTMLSLKERREIFEIVSDVALEYYDEQSFALNPEDE